MASHLETKDVLLLYSPQYVTVRGRVTTVDPHVQSILSSQYWGGPQVTEKTVPGVWDKLYGQRLDQDPTPQMSSGRSRTPQQEKSSLQKSLFPVMDGRSVRRHPVVTYRYSEWDGTPIKGTF